ncbi:hypothetical protein FRB93_011509 [Tulasnella sp. JGI-2019a]|nr:hypothetical protein FRB93_011509 [Tulasnella sp. JGI-2019a]
MKETFLLIGYINELDLTLPSHGVELLQLLLSIRADGSEIRDQIREKSVDQLLASSIYSWKAAQRTDSDPIPPLPDLPPTSQTGSLNGQQIQEKYMDEIDINDCGDDDSGDCGDEKLCADELEDPVGKVQSWASSVAAHNDDQEHILDIWARSHHDRIVAKIRRAKSLDG